MFRFKGVIIAGLFYTYIILVCCFLESNVYLINFPLGYLRQRFLFSDGSVGSFSARLY